MSEEVLFSEENCSDFSADDDLKDPTFEVPKANRRRKITEARAAVSKKKRLDGSCKNIIFKSEFYTDCVNVSDQNKDTTVAKCVLCDRSIRGSVGVSSNFVTHLRLKHPQNYMRYKYLKSGDLNDKDTQERFNDKILNFIVDSAVPVSIVDRQSFIGLFEDTGLKVMSRQTAMKKLDDHYKNMMAKIKSEISNAKFFCTTADIWSGNHRSFFGYTCHWLTADYQRKSVALACKRLRGIHSSENISQIITEINSSFGLNSYNIILTVTDNGSNFVKAFKDHGVENIYQQEQESDGLPSFENVCLPKHHRCSSHTLHLLATSDLTKILMTDQNLYHRHIKTFEKCNILWKKCKWPKSSELIEETLGSSLVVPVVTRWSSLYEAVIKLLRHKDKLNELCDRLSLLYFSSGDIEHLDSYKLLMEPIAKALDFLQGEKNVNYGCLLPALMTLSNKLQKLKNRKGFHLRVTADLLEQKLRERFKAFFELSDDANIAIAAAVLNPAVKTTWLKVLQRSAPELTTNAITNRVLQSVCEFANNENFTSKRDVISNGFPLQYDHFDFSDEDVENEVNISSQISAKSTDELDSLITNQFYSYLNDPDFGPEIWSKYNLLKDASLAFNTPLTSSAPVERLFSFAGIINSPRRGSLHDFSFEKLVVMKANKNYMIIN